MSTVYHQKQNNPTITMPKLAIFFYATNRRLRCALNFTELIKGSGVAGVLVFFLNSSFREI